MKRILAVILVLFLLCGSALAAEGTRVDFGETFSLVRPNTLENYELTSDDLAEGLVYAAVSDELELYVMRYDMDMDKEELYDMYRGDEFMKGVTVVSTGGVEYITYSIIDEGIGATFIGNDGNYYEFLFYCMTTDAEAEAKVILDSIQAL